MTDNPVRMNEQQYRASAYSVLAALLRDVPASDVLNHVADFSKLTVDFGDSKDEMLLSMSTLGLAAQSSQLSDIDDEFHELFIGLGRGELVPYGSWYLTGFLMEQPLSVLRDDLVLLGFERDENIVESEDHVAALCEVMTMIVLESLEDTELNVGQIDEKQQRQQAIFFEKHIAPWMGDFFDDLAKAKSAVFYRAVGRFGAAFLKLEKRYLMV